MLFGESKKELLTDGFDVIRSAMSTDVEMDVREPNVFMIWMTLQAPRGSSIRKETMNEKKSNHFDRFKPKCEVVYSVRGSNE